MEWLISILTSVLMSIGAKLFGTGLEVAGRRVAHVERVAECPRCGAREIERRIGFRAMGVIVAGSLLFGVGFCGGPMVVMSALGTAGMSLLARLGAILLGLMMLVAALLCFSLLIGQREGLPPIACRACGYRWATSTAAPTRRQ